MCMMCDGASHDEVLFHLHGQIDRKVWAIIPVGDDPPERSWVYTIGLVAFDHPELVVMDCEPSFAAKVLDELGERIRAGDRFINVDDVELAGGLTAHLVD